MTATIVAVNLNDVLSQVDRRMGDYEAAAAYALGQVALAYQRQVQEALGQSTHPAGTKTPAEPGGPPSRITGSLLRSIMATPVVQGLRGYETTVGAGMVYARALELGNPMWKSDVKYPYMEPTAQIFAQTADRVFLDAFKYRWEM